MPDVPTIYELMDAHKTPDADRRLVNVILASGSIGRPYMAPPGLPPARVKSLRDAFNRAMGNPELLAEVNKRQLEADPSTGEEIEAVATEAVAQPPDVIERMKKLLGK